jgi:hypothetical protein
LAFHPVTLLKSLGDLSQRTIWAVGAAGLGLAVGIGSAMYSLSVAGLMPPKQAQGWQEWNLDPESRTLPYALGHFLAADQMPPPRTSQQFVRKTDNDGKALRGDCAITIVGSLPTSRWWTLQSATLNGRIPNKQSIADMGTAVREADNSLVFKVSATPQPGNWMLPASNGSYMLVLTLHDTAVDTGDSKLLSVTTGDCA